MKICITSQGENLESEVDPRFGRCAYFVFVDSETLAFESIKNDQAQAMGGAGVQAGKIVVEKEVNTLLTGNVGPNAYQTLNTGGINVITGVTGTVKDTVDRFNRGEFQTTDKPNVESHFGMKN